MRLLRPLLVPALLGLVLVGIAFLTRSGRFTRDNPGLPINTAMRQALGQMSLPPHDAEWVAIRYPEARVAPSGLRYVIERPGAGEMPRRGEIVSVHFRGWLLDGTVIDDSYARGEGPYNFAVDQGRVMPGWDEAVSHMQPGEKRTVIIPYWLGFGEKGQRGKIPPKATLIYELELLPRGGSPAPPTT
jgi:hypothetical protein